MWTEPEQIARLVEHVKARAGAGWELLGPALQRALIAEAALAAVLNTNRKRFHRDEIVSLLLGMLRSAGLGTTEPTAERAKWAEYTDERESRR